MPQKLGQHFLKNKFVLSKITKALELEDGDLVIEIGPGHGELTKQIANQNLKVKIISIEKDKTLAKALEEEKIDNLEVILGDALEVLPKITVNLPASAQYKIVGNIPYYITGRLLRVIGQLEKKPSQTVLLIQKEVAQRMCAKPPFSNLLSVSVQFWARPKILFFVSAGNFSPPPKVDSAVVKLVTKKEKQDEFFQEKYYDFVRKAFKQPRKTILNNLTLSGFDKEKCFSLLKSFGLGADSRPQELSADLISQIARQL